jgi:hypothetical protein
MKKTILSLTLAGLSVGTFAQGTLNFANNILGNSTGGVTAPNATSGDALAPGTYTVALYWDSTATSAGASIVPGSTGLVLEATYLSSAATWPIPGQFAGGNVTVAGLAPGTVGYFEVAGWTGNAASYAQATGDAGLTTLFGNNTGGAGNPPSPPVNLTGWSGNLNLIPPVPEPTTIALGGLGAAALLLFRRRK